MSFNHSTLVPWPWALESFDDPAAMMTRPLGEPVLDEPGRQVRRIVFDDYGRCLYLKRQREPRPWRQLPMLLRAARPHTAAGREATMIAALRAADMPVARVVSWGQRRVLGVPSKATFSPRRCMVRRWPRRWRRRPRRSGGGCLAMPGD